MSDIVKKPREQIPKAEVFAKATELGLAPSDDRFDRFRKAALLDELIPIAGTNQRAFTLEQANRFAFLLGLSKALGSKRPRPSALAFWLCWYGFDDIPAELICEHIDRTMLSFLAMMRREFERKRVPISGVRDPKRWEKVGKPWGKFMLKYYLRRAIGNPIAQQAFSWTFSLALRAIASETSFDAVAPMLQRVAYVFGIDKAKVEGLREIWSAFSEGLQLFALDVSKNPLIGTIREINAKDPELIIPIVRDTRLVVYAMGAVFPIFQTAKAPLAEDPNDKTLAYIAKHFAPGMAAVVALTRDFPHAIEMCRKLREGNFQPLLEEFHQVKVVTDDMMRKIGIEAKE